VPNSVPITPGSTVRIRWDYWLSLKLSSCNRGSVWGWDTMWRWTTRPVCTVVIGAYAVAASGWPVCGQCYESWAINCTVYSAGAQLPSSSHPESHWEEPVLLSARDCHKHTRRRKIQTNLWTLTTTPRVQTHNV